MYDSAYISDTLQTVILHPYFLVTFLFNRSLLFLGTLKIN